ncbi:MAG TPA: hypothetical protein VOA41_18235 [Candidatus Dormibacteraeota bacterium]|nr:hypothetical protein [Candidatus Dormibacteraeota bacterium]
MTRLGQLRRSAALLVVSVSAVVVGVGALWPYARPRAVRLLKHDFQSAGMGTDQMGLPRLVAFKLLHKRYPTSEWTKRTPYWF